MITDRQTNATIRRLAGSATANPAIPLRTPRLYTLAIKSPPHDWKVWLNLDPADSTWKYQVANRAMTADGGFPSGTLAGQIVKPDGSIATIALTNWATITGACTISLKLSIGVGTFTCTWGVFSDTSGLTADPAILVIPMASIEGDSTNGYNVKAEFVTGIISLAGCVIPQTISGYTRGDQQFLSHDANGGLKWVSVSACNQ